MIDIINQNQFNDTLEGTLKSQTRIDIINDVFKRRGYIARVQMSRKCGCIEFDSPKPNCLICGATGISYTFQANRRIFNEQAIAIDSNIIRVKYGPLVEVKSVSPIRGNIQEFYTIIAFSDYEVKVSGNYQLQLYDHASIDYSFRRFVKVVEQIIGDGTTRLNMSCMTQQDEFSHGKAGDIVSVIKVEDKTTMTELTVNSFIKQVITLDNNTINGNVIEVTYEYAPLIEIIATNVTFDKQKKEWTALPTGTMLISFPDWVTIGEYDIITLLGVEQRATYSVLRGESNSNDKLPAFDIADILEVVDTENPSIIYKKGIDYELYNYNEIKWISSNKPASENSYSVSYFYNPSFRVAHNVPVFQNSENRRFPHSIICQLYDKLKQSNLAGA